MKNRIIRIVMLTALIVVTLIGMTNPSTVLGAKPVSEYVDVVLMECSTTYQVDVVVELYLVEKNGYERLVGIATPSSCVKPGGMDADSTLPYMAKPNKWIATLAFWDPTATPPVVYCNFPETGTSFPATITRTCPDAGSDTATVTIGTPRLFP
jgi:hypothetical protein